MVRALLIWVAATAGCSEGDSDGGAAAPDLAAARVDGGGPDRGAVDQSMAGLDAQAVDLGDQDLAGMSDLSATPDDAAPAGDLAEADLAGAIDAGKKDLAGADLGKAPDLAIASDLGKSSDLGMPADLAKPSDLARLPDLAKPSDLAALPDLAKPADLASSSDGGGPIGACPVFPFDNEWNRDISADPLDPNSAQFMAKMNGALAKLHPDFGSDTASGIPWISVPGSQPKVAMTFANNQESDPGPYPFPANAPVEGGANSMGDRHVIVIDRDACVLYETYRAFFVGPGWKADAGAVWSLKSNALRPDYWTSADAAGLPIFPGLIRRDEAVAGEIKHALRFTVGKTQAAFQHPATHYASNSVDATLPPMGLRVRLKASYDLSAFKGHAKVILTAMKRYGMFLADNGSDWFFSGESNAKWDDNDLGQLKGVPASAFEVVKLGKLFK